MGADLPISPLAPARFPDLPAIAGARFAACEAQVRYRGRPDVMLAALAPGTTLAGTFTRSATRSAAVLDCQSKLNSSTIDTSAGAAIVVNAGNANAFTGAAGDMSVQRICAATAAALGVPETRVYTASTGVIGELLPDTKITDALPKLTQALSADGLAEAAQAIRTTDTFAKGAETSVEIDGKTVRIAGIAKGSGMIAPDMATMLVYIFTDAAVAQDKLQALVSNLTETTFNCITVDSDTSTSDTLLVAATGASGVDATDDLGFAAALRSIMLDLAHQVVRDGEGATKFIEIAIGGALNDADARVHGLAIANSPLVKTAIAGEDPNWGRIVMAIGKSGAAADRDKLSIWFDDILVAEKGWVAPGYVEEDAAAHMRGAEIRIAVDLGLGAGTATVWTCDLTHGYIDINADYRS